MVTKAEYKNGDAASKEKYSDSESSNSSGEEEGISSKPEVSIFERLFRFPVSDLTSWSTFVRLLNSPRDGSGLALFRISFGLLMIIDAFHERGLSQAEWVFGQKDECSFPLFSFIKPLPLVWMYMVYLALIIGSLGVTFGFYYSYCSRVHVVCYWYLFLMETQHWNNHSYLFGLISFLLSLLDTNRYWSLDAYFGRVEKNGHVPLWNYTIIRAQLFLVYFIAGLKKMDPDWVRGYSMQELSRHSVFDLFRLVMSDQMIDILVVHLGGLTIDLSVGYLLFFDFTREIGLFVCTAFNFMNSQMFSIGMFPYVMLVSQTIFCNCNWPRGFVKRAPRVVQCVLPADVPFHCSSHCIYPIQTNKKIKKALVNCKDSRPTTIQLRHAVSSVFVVLFLSWQAFMPFSHGITKGYNSWTKGLYGYSWDMMIHTWNRQHIRITFKNLDTNETGYLAPSVWSNSDRWTSDTALMKQYATCVENNLRTLYNMTNVELYFDIWISMNKRFQQRFCDPNVDMVKAEWSPFKKPTWVLPLLIDLSDWRTTISEIKKQRTDEFTDVLFIADFPGMHLANYIQPDYKNTSLEVINGEVLVEFVDEGRNVTLGANDSTKIPADAYHNVHTISSIPSSYYYVFSNTTEKEIMEKNVADTETETEGIVEPKPHPFVLAFKKQIRRLRKGTYMIGLALYCLLTNSDIKPFINATIIAEHLRE